MSVFWRHVAAIALLAPIWLLVGCVIALERCGMGRHADTPRRTTHALMDCLRSAGDAVIGRALAAVWLWLRGDPRSDHVRIAEEIVRLKDERAAAVTARRRRSDLDTRLRDARTRQLRAEMGPGWLRAGRR